MARKLQIPTHVAKRVDLSLNAKACYASIEFHCYREEWCWPTHETIGRQWGLSRNSVKRGLAELKATKIIDCERRITGDGNWHSNRYRIRPDPLFPKQKIQSITVAQVGPG